LSLQSKVNSKKIILVGNPNVGKSALFQALSGQYVEVSNYPGTTVELSQAAFGEEHCIIDTPGVYSVSALNDEEKVTLGTLLGLQPDDLILNVVSALSLERDLFLTLHLIDLRIPFVLVINQIDEARKRGLEINPSKINAILKVQTFLVSALTNEGLEELKEFIRANLKLGAGVSSPELTGQIGQALIEHKELKTHLQALLWLEEDEETINKLKLPKPPKGSRNKIFAKRRERVNRLTEGLLQGSKPENPFVKKLDDILIHPVLGTIISFAIAFFFLYQVLGVWVAGDLVNLVEKQLLEKYWNPLAKTAVAQFVPVQIKTTTASFLYPTGMLGKGPSFQELKNAEFIFSPADLVDSPGQKTPLKQTIWSSAGTILAGKYGLLTLTITYLLGLLLPLVWAFYFSWALFEDTGYLPRLAVLADGFLRKIGLNGRGIIPLVLGLGCVTMAVVTTRLMSNKREQLIMMILLGIAVPCSAQLGIIQGLLVKVGGLSGWLVWLTVLLLVLCLCGFLANKLLPGKPTPLLLDLPPLRMPRPKNLLLKANQKSWFFLKESGVAFLWASTAITLLQVTGVLGWLIESLKPLVAGILHLPKEVALSFLLGMVRRDFGAFGLLDLNLSKIQAVTACVTLTLFVPCIATLGVMVKERNFKTAFGIWFTSWVFGFGVGGLLTRLLELGGFK
jgi:ferrous iron transport protein B